MSPNWPYDGQQPRQVSRCAVCFYPLHARLIERRASRHLLCEGLPIPATRRIQHHTERNVVDYVPGRQPTPNEIPVGRGHPVTSLLMARKARGVRRLVLQALWRGPMSDFDLEDHLGRTHQSVSGARRKLVLDALVEDSGERAVNRYGNKVIVWRLTADLASGRA